MQSRHIFSHNNTGSGHLDQLDGYIQLIHATGDITKGSQPQDNSWTNTQTSSRTRCSHSSLKWCHNWTMNFCLYVNNCPMSACMPTVTCARHMQAQCLKFGTKQQRLFSKPICIMFVFKTIISAVNGHVLHL